MPQKSIQIQGLAINECISRNNIKYTAEELQKSFKELENKPILLDHDAKVLSTIGKVTETTFNNNGINYKGWIKGDALVEMVEDGRIDACSIGAFCENLIAEEEGADVMTASGIHFLELSMTPTPGVPSASVKQIIQQQERIWAGEKIKMSALVESFKIKETDSGEMGKVKDEKTVDGSGKKPGDTLAGKDEGKAALLIKCPLCDAVVKKVNDFEKHAMDAHKLTDVQVDDYLIQAGFRHEDSKHEEKEEGIHKGNNPGNLIGKNEEPKESAPVKVKEAEDYAINPEEEPKKITVDPVALADEIQKQKAEHPEFELRDIVKLAIDHLKLGNEYDEHFINLMVEVVSKISEEKMVSKTKELYGQEPVEQPVPSAKPEDDKNKEGAVAPTDVPKSPFGSEEEEKAFAAKMAFMLNKQKEQTDVVPAEEEEEKEAVKCEAELPIKKDGEDKMADEKMVAELKEQISALTKQVSEMKLKPETKSIVTPAQKSLKEQGYKCEVFEGKLCFYKEATGPKGTY